MPAYAIPKLPTAFTFDRPSKATKRITDEAHLAFIRKLPSVVSGKSPCEACHIRAGSALHRKKHTGMGQKPDDFWTVPLTPEEHREQHSENEMAFWRKHEIDPFELAIKIYEVTGDIPAAEKIIRSAGPQARASNGE